MRVMFLGQNSPDKFSGGRYHAWMMAEAAAYMGHEVLFVTDNKPIFYEDFSKFPGHREVKISRRPVLEEKGWDLPDWPCRVLVVIPHGKPTQYFYSRAREFAEKRRARLVMINFESGNWFNALSPTKRDESQWEGWKICCRGASMVLSISAEGTKHAREFYTHVPSSVLFRHCYPCINSVVADSVVGLRREKRIVVLTRFDVKSSHKGGYILPDLLCEAMRGYTLVMIMGITEQHQEFVGQVRAKARQYGIELEILTRISDEEKFRQLKRASLMLFPSFFEGFGLPPVEALYCNVPCIAFDLPVLREVSGDGLIYVERGNIAAFRKAIAKRLSVVGGDRNGESRQRILGVARFENLADRVDAVLEEAERGRGTRRSRRMGLSMQPAA